jgi:hypothetical protein
LGELGRVGRIHCEPIDAQDGQYPVEFPFTRFRCVGGRRCLPHGPGCRTCDHGTRWGGGSDDVDVAAPRHHEIIQIQVDDSGIAVDTGIVGNATTVAAPPQFVLRIVAGSLGIVLLLTVDIGFATTSSRTPLGDDGAVTQILVALDLGIDSLFSRQTHVAGLRFFASLASRHADLTETTGTGGQARIGDDGFRDDTRTGFGQNGRGRTRDEPGVFLDGPGQPPLSGPSNDTALVSSS